MSERPFGFPPKRTRCRPAPLPSTLGQWFRVWRWPAGLVAGIVLWIALVAVVGAAPPPAPAPEDLATSAHPVTTAAGFGSDLGE